MSETLNVNLGQEIDKMASFLSCLDPININPEKEDMCKWILARNDQFPIWSSNGMLEISFFTWNSIWGLKIPSQVLFFFPGGGSM